MKHMFFYSRVQPVEDQEGQFKTFTDSLNIEKIIRTISMDDGKLLILMDDLHRRNQQVPVTNKQGKITAYKNVEDTFQSEITLEIADVERFKKLTNIEE